jgi:hypothetical protein
VLPLCLSTDQLFAAADEADKTAPQGKDPPGADNTSQTNQPLVPRKGVITPPPTGVSRGVRALANLVLRARVEGWP